MSELKQFQTNLAVDSEKKNLYVNAEIDSEEDDDQEKIISVSKSKKIDNIMMQELILQQKRTLQAHKKIYKYKNELDTQEVKMRYLKLDLNNATLERDNFKEDNNVLKHNLYIAKCEVWMTRGLFALYMAYLFSTLF